jgi:hypothetical protein
MPNATASVRIQSLVAAFVADLSGLVRQAAVLPRGKGAKRRPEEIEATTARLLAHIKKHPGQRIEQIADSMGVSTRGLTLPMKKLKKAKSVKTKGQKRATEYWAK